MSERVNALMFVCLQVVFYLVSFDDEHGRNVCQNHLTTTLSKERRREERKQ